MQGNMHAVETLTYFAKAISEILKLVKTLTSCGRAACKTKIKWVTLFKSSFFTEDWYTIYTNITTKLNWKLFTKLIKSPSKEAWVLDRQRA